MTETARRGRFRPGGSGAARRLLVALAVAAALAGTGCAPAGVVEPPSSDPAAAATTPSATRSPSGVPEPGTGERVGGRSPTSDPTAADAEPDPEAAPAQDAAPAKAVPTAAPTGANRSRVPVASAALRPADPAPAPVRLDYPAIGAALPVTPTGVAGDGQMAVPEDAATAGWYRFGPAPADGEGNTVIAAHAGSEQTPEGPLYALREARPDDVVTVEDAAGDKHDYRVTAVEQLGKEGLDFTPYFARSGPERLVLVTCGGQWLPERQSYADNIVVVAESLD